MAFAVVATWTAKEGEEKRILDVIARVTPPSRAEEKNLVYQAHVSPDDPRTFVLYEQYTDEEGFEEHRASAHFQEHVLGYALQYLESREIKTYRTVDG
ncbi:MAG: putative quinol monooxygenase [Actinomycetes bacterium]